MRRLAALLVLVPLAPLAAQTTMKPGQWEMTFTVTNAQIPGAPPEAMAAMKKPHVVRHCVTPQEAAAGPREMLKAAPSCKVTRFNMAGGRIDSAMSCADPRGGTLLASSKGSFTPTNVSVTSHAVITGPGGKGQMVTDTKVDGRWTGTCAK